jgi:hypothetical protein
MYTYIYSNIIYSVLCGLETWSVTLGAIIRLRLLDSKKGNVLPITGHEGPEGE